MLLLGMDGGGTRTTAIVTNEHGSVLAKVSGATINYYAVGMEKARAHGLAMIEELGHRFGFTEFDAAFIGMSALDQEASEEEIHTFAGPIIPADTIFMHSDCYIALVATTLGKPGGLIISGTGSMGMAYTSAEELYTVGGWGYMLGDQGSAYDMALLGIKAAIAAADGMAPPTLLTEEVLKYFAIPRMRDLIDRYYRGAITRQEAAGFAVRVAACAKAGDVAAQQIEEQAVVELAKLAVRLVEQLKDQEEIIIGLYGGVFQQNHNISCQLKRRIEQQFPQVSMGLPPLPPEAGAIISCMHRLGMTLSTRIIAELHRGTTLGTGAENNSQGGERIDCDR